jgi:predicted NBD/HSP70 family sugar kinase
LTAAHISEGAIHADFACIQLIKHAGKAIGEVAAKLVNFFNPSSLVIGGGLTGFGNIFIGAIREAVISRSPHLATYDLNVRMSELEGKAGPIGAGTLILEYIFSSGQFSTTIDRNIEESTGA